MSAVVCTLFENSYHFGLAVLTNSLYHNGYKGAVFAGYRGELPAWCASAAPNESLNWTGASTLQIKDDLVIHFLPVNNEYHLTNYKPHFILRLWDGPASNATAIAYFDPDIVIRCKWSFFETWMSYGVSLVHEISSNDMPPTHPIRLAWNKVIEKANLAPTRKLHSYINGGFCGVAKKYKEFLEVWIAITNTAIAHFKLTPGQWAHSYDRTYAFYAQDQDALNITAMCSQSPISEMGPEGMDFIHGGWTMSHAVGSPKPWKKKFVASALKGRPPSLVDRAYWSNALGPINVYSAQKVSVKKMSISLSAFIGRFYRCA
jgi:hypothetical protein